MANDAKTAGSVYAELISEQLAEERARKASIEARGLSVITTSGALVTVLFALGSLISGIENYSLPDPARWLLVAALAAFLLAAIAGIVANFPLRYREVSVSGLRRLTQPEWWTNLEPAASRRAAEARVNVLDRARAQPMRFKVNALIAAMAVEVVAVMLVAGAVGIILTPGVGADGPSATPATQPASPTSTPTPARAVRVDRTCWPAAARRTPCPRFDGTGRAVWLQPQPFRALD